MFIDLILLSGVVSSLTSYNSQLSILPDSLEDLREATQLAIADGPFINHHDLVVASFDLTYEEEEVLSHYYLTPSLHYLEFYLRKNYIVSTTESFYSGSSLSNGDGDAFRHTYGAAFLCYWYGVNFALDITAAHEQNADTDLQRMMDLHNDANGIRLYEYWNALFRSSVPANLDPCEDLANFICHCIKYGEIYDCVKFNSTNDDLVYTNDGISHTDSFGLLSSIDSIDKEDFDFECQYFFYNKNKTVYTNNNNSIATTRLRTGFIEEEYIVLSPKRENAGYAFLELDFNSEVESIGLDMCLWSDDERLNDNYSSASIYAYVDGYYYRVYDLLNDTVLVENRNNPDCYRFIMPQGTTKIKFTVTSDSIGDRNKGRLCLGDMNIYYKNANYDY